MRRYRDMNESLVDWLEKESTKPQQAQKRRHKLDARETFKRQKLLSPIVRLNDAKKRAKEAKAELLKALVDMREAEAELNDSDKQPNDHQNRLPIMANHNRYTSNLHYTLDGNRGHLCVESPKGGILIILTSDIIDNLHDLNNYTFPLILQARERYDTTQFNKLVERLTDVGNKSNSDEYKNMARRLHEGHKSQQRETLTEMTKIGMYVSALMGETIKIQFITKSEHADQLEE